MATHLHHYKGGVCADPRAIGGPCGEPQRYSPPEGHGEFPYVMMMKKEDLRDLLHYVVGPDYDPHGYYQRLMERVDSHLS